VLAAAENEAGGADAALERLCRAYWYPLYAHVRRRGYDAQEAPDLTQAFFERLLEKSFLRGADRNKGRFRTFLLAALDHFLANEWRRNHTRKRGGGRAVLSLDDGSIEDRYALEPSHDETPERLFERRWALALLDHAMERLAGECAGSGKTDFFEVVKSLLGGERAELPYGQLSARLGLTENAFNLSLLRLRRRYGEIIREEIAGTVARPDEVDDELRHLMECLRR
jgi:RNA polymerase sigma-70 factor (ECF subfamily)